MHILHIRLIQEFVIEPSLLDLATYQGYKGGIVLRFRTSDELLVSKIMHYCDNINVEVHHKYNIIASEVYCIVPDEDIYELKR